MSAHDELKPVPNDHFMFESVQTNSPHDEQYGRRTSASSQPYFVLKAKNHEVIGRSETYSSGGAMEKGFQSVKKNGPVATVNDITSSQSRPNPIGHVPPRTQQGT